MSIVSAGSYCIIPDMDEKAQVTNETPKVETPTPTIEPTPSVAKSTEPAKKSGGNKLVTIILSILGCCLVLVILLVVGGGIAARLLVSQGGTKLTESIIEKGLGENAKVNIKDGNIDIKTDKGTFSTSGKLPDNFPTDVPTYPGAKIISTITAPENDENGGGIVVGFETSDSITKVASFYKAELTKNAWETTENFDGNDGFAITAVKANRNLYVAGGMNDNKVTITLSLTNEK